MSKISQELTFLQWYKKELVSQLYKTLECKNIMQVPKLEKITLNMGLGEAAGDKKLLANALEDMTLIAGQQPIVTRARKSIAGFKIREGWPIGCKVTLRGKHMYDFFERLVRISLPRVRDFRGFSSKGFDGRGNYSLGLKEQIIFVEIDYDKIDKIRGLDITITTSAQTNKEGFELLKAFGFPFKSDKLEEK